MSIQEIIAGGGGLLIVLMTLVQIAPVNGVSSIENQETAFEKSLHTAIEIMSQETKDFISAVYGDLDKWLSAKIEATVNTVKAKK